MLKPHVSFRQEGGVSNPSSGMEHMLRCSEILQVALVIREVRGLILALYAVGLIGSFGRRSRRRK